MSLRARRIDVRQDDEIDVVDGVPGAMEGARIVEREVVDVLRGADHPLAGGMIGNEQAVELAGKAGERPAARRASRAPGARRCARARHRPR